LKKHGIPLPSPEAIDLARLVQSAAGADSDNAARQQSIDTLTSEMFRTFRGDGKGPCDESMKQCSQVARRLASAETDRWAEEKDERVAVMRAVVFSARMSDAHIEAARAFARTRAGKAFVSGLLNTDSRDLGGDLSQKMTSLLIDPESGRATAEARRAMFDRFYSETGNLPRAPLPSVPRPPAPPAPPKPRQ
jgi:hypothetical protein